MKRTFVIHTQPSVADPAHLIKVSEFEHGMHIANYSDMSELKKPIEDVEHAQYYDAGYQRGQREIYAKLGVQTPEDLENILKKIK